MRATKGMGNGKIENIRDVIYIDPDKFNRLKTEEMAEEIKLMVPQRFVIYSGTFGNYHNAINARLEKFKEVRDTVVEKAIGDANHSKTKEGLVL